jgi:DNA invertase Pin-like site-specific DNA recombinase
MNTSFIVGSDRLEILKLAAEGVTAQAMTVWFPYPLGSIRRVILGGAASKARKMGPELAAQARKMHDQGLPAVAIAKALGVHRNSVHRVLGGHTWATT